MGISMGVGILLLLATATTQVNANELTVLHDATPPPAYLDLGAPGDSVGDMRIWHFNGKTQDGTEVVMDWIMTTTGLTTAGAGVASRVTLGVFSFTEEDADQILLQGVGLYPATDSTFKPASSLSRAIIGGSGKFARASGEVVSAHLEDGNWKHEFHLK